MQTNKTYSEDFKDFITKELTTKGGYQTLYRFPNNYGASVIHHDYSYGLELAVTQYDDKGAFGLAYHTFITDDVIGNIEDEKTLNELLQSIKEL